VGRACTVCTSPNRAEIDKALVSGESNRRIAAHFSVPETSLRRHKTEHLPLVVEAAKQRSAPKQTGAPNRRTEATQAASVVAVAGEIVHQEKRELRHVADVGEELARCFHRVNLLFDACDGWLRDADDPTRYDIGPRAEEIVVTYTIPNGDGIPFRAKGKLSDLLAEVRTGKGAMETTGETKYADPRTLVLKTAEQLQSQTQLLARLLGLVTEKHEVAATVAVLHRPDLSRLSREELADLERLALKSARSGSDQGGESSP